MLRFHLNDMTHEAQLKSFNKWLVNNVDILPKVEVVSNLDTPIAAIPYKGVERVSFDTSEANEMNLPISSVEVLWQSYMES